MTKPSAIVVGSGPNGLTAAIILAQAGLSVVVLEAEDDIGGGTRTKEITLPGFKHDLCSSVYPLGASSPIFNHLTLEKHGLEWIVPPVQLAHPFDDGHAAVLLRSLKDTASTLRSDAKAYLSLMSPFVNNWPSLVQDVLAPLHFPKNFPLFLKFGIKALVPVEKLVRHRFQTDQAQALLAGIAAHSSLRLSALGSSAFALVLGAPAHVVGWPIARGGAQSISGALTSCLLSLGGKVETKTRVKSLKDLSQSDLILLNVTPRQFLEMGSDLLPPHYFKKLQNYRYGPGVFKIDWALSEPIPWKSAECRQSATVHLGGSLDEISASEDMVWQNKHPEKPFVIVTQPSLFDSSRAPEKKHTAWAYCRVPLGSPQDMTPQIESQVERFAPGFKDIVLARHVMFPSDLEAYNANLVGGDVNGGSNILSQIIFRPSMSTKPYTTPLKNVFLCSSSTPPGGGVHGMCGYHAAHVALRESHDFIYKP